jgi:succinyl-diaminopimelate desuccinylase
MDEIRLRDIDAFIGAEKNHIIRDIARLVAINSVEGKPEEGAPYGRAAREALGLGLEIAQELGLSVRNCEDRIGYAQIGEAEDDLAPITHVDVVPAGEGWTGDPFTLLVMFLPLYLLYEFGILLAVR